jgi:hypothetical protein
MLVPCVVVVERVRRVEERVLWLVLSVFYAKFDAKLEMGKLKELMSGEMFFFVRWFCP